MSFYKYVTQRQFGLLKKGLRFQEFIVFKKEHVEKRGPATQSCLLTSTKHCEHTQSCTHIHT